VIGPAQHSVVTSRIAVRKNFGYLVVVLLINPFVQASKFLFTSTILSEVTAREITEWIHRESCRDRTVRVQDVRYLVDVQRR